VSAFTEATAVEPLGDGAWRATCDGGWSTQLGPNGGYLAAIVLRAMAAQLDDPQRRPRSLTCHYLRPPHAGDVRIDVTVERSGRSLSTLTARLTQDERLCILAVGAFAIDLDGVLDYGASPPATVDPEATSRLFAVAEVPMTQHFDMRPALGEPLYTGADEALSGGWVRFDEDDGDPLDEPALAMLSDAWWPSPLPRLTRPAALPTIDLTVHFRSPPVGDGHVLAVFRSSTSAGGFFEEDGELWSRDGVLLAQSRQLALLVEGGG
jgi:acyl-CoA thioesterase